MIIDDIKQRTDIVAYIERHVSLTKSGAYYKACCPFHSENTPSFMVSAERQTWHCYGACARGGDVIDFAMAYHNWDIKTAIAELAKSAGIQTTVNDGQSQRNATLLGLLNSASEFYERALWGRAGTAALAYVRERGISDESIRHWRLGYAPASWDAMTKKLREIGYRDDDILGAGIALKKQNLYDRFRNRLLFPICDRQGRIVGFGARQLDKNDTPKYLNSPHSALFDKSALLYGWHRARDSIRDKQAVIIVEGYTDVIQAHQAGYTNVVAQMGTALTEKQVEALRGVNQVVLALDGDEAGLAAMRRAMEHIVTLQADVRIALLPPGSDPDDAIREGTWDATLAKGEPVADFIIRVETQDITADAPVVERSKVAERILPMLMRVESDLIRRDNVQKLALRLRLDERELMRLARPPAKQKATLRLIDDTPQRDEIEYYVVKAMLQQPGEYVRLLNYFEELGLREFNKDDFYQYRHHAESFIQAFNNPTVSLNEAVHDALQSDANLQDTVAVDTHIFQQQALRLRLRRIEREVADMIHLNQLDNVRAINREKAVIMRLKNQHLAG